VAFLQRGVELAPAVARLLVTLPDGRYYGTGFRIGEDLLLTNHHVLFGAAGTSATGVEAWLRYELGVTHFAHRSNACWRDASAWELRGCFYSASALLSACRRLHLKDDPRAPAPINL
jgi:hypothetical protein